MYHLHLHRGWLVTLSYQTIRFQSHYAVLGVSEYATEKEIKEAYIHLCKKNHPDQSKGTDKVEVHKKFVKINEAYGVLSKPSLRTDYDNRYKNINQAWNKAHSDKQKHDTHAHNDYYEYYNKNKQYYYTYHQQKYQEARNKYDEETKRKQKEKWDKFMEDILLRTPKGSSNESGFTDLNAAINNAPRWIYFIHSTMLATFLMFVLLLVICKKDVYVRDYDGMSAEEYNYRVAKCQYENNTQYLREK